MIISLKRFINFGNNTVSKDTKAVKCDPQITIPLHVDNEVMGYRFFKLIASINHSGNLESGHYMAHISDTVSGNWFHCNDAAIVPSEKSPPGTLCYILFYKAD